jgi:hypothetical protein
MKFGVEELHVMLSIITSFVEIGAVKAVVYLTAYMRFCPIF